MKKWVCTVCGYVYEGENAPEKCPQCQKIINITTLQHTDAISRYK